MSWAGLRLRERTEKIAFVIVAVIVIAAVHLNGNAPLTVIEPATPTGLLARS